jgi:hypothetical protein
VLVGVSMVCMAAGWYFIQGPGGQAIRDYFAPRPEEKRESKPDALADNRGGKDATQESRDAEPPKEKQEDKRSTDGSTDKDKPPPKDNKPEETKPAAGVTFQKDVLPVFETRCISCHGGGRKRGGLDMRTVAALLKGGDKGPALVLGAPDRSPVWTTIDGGRMPPGKNVKLTAAEKTLVRDWISTGAR